MMPRYLKELPASARGKYERGPYPEHVKIVAALKRKPGQWLVVKTFSLPQSASAFARKIREGTFIAFRDGEYEAQARSNMVYARFIK